MDDKTYAELKTYLRRLGWALASLPEKDRDDIVEETRVHVLARVDQGQSVRDALAALGSADGYARQFVDEMEVSGALASQGFSQVLSVVVKRAHRSLTAGIAFLLVLFLGTFAVGGLVTAAMKPFDPEHTGLWTSDRGAFFFGATEKTAGLHELLGPWVYPFAVVDLVVVWFLARLILLWAARTLARKD